MLKRIKHILNEIFFLIKKEKIYFIAPLLFFLALITILVYQIGPSAIVTFIYAGV